MRLAGPGALPSATNFVYAKAPDADALRDRMAERNIMIRGPYGRWTERSRVSTGKMANVARYAEALPQLV